MNGRWTITLIILSIFCGGIYAQDSAESPTKWKTVSSDKEEFDFEIPKTGFQNNSNSIRNDYLGRYFGKNNGDLFYVMTNPESTRHSFEAVLKFASNFENQCDQEDYTDYRAYSCTFDESSEFRHSFRYIRTVKRTYLFYAVSALGANPDVDRFLGSPRMERNDIEFALVQIAKIDELWRRFQAGEYAPEQGADRIESDEKRPAKYLPTPEDDKSIQLQTKPRPGYTQMARMFAITGSVKLRVTFNSDRSIGAVTVVDALPFGLTSKAVEAAKSIQFTPEIRRGYRLTVVKTIAYNFSIY